MGVAFRVGRDRGLLPFWYGEYKTKDGRRVCQNLGVKIAGEPPPSLRVSPMREAQRLTATRNTTGSR
ncbi:MAG: hypothetical protein FWF84_06345 [Kiritimatiellaeota bacterium]|nr:hypothetical protein [Kiritimatiellota bacterium]